MTEQAIGSLRSALAIQCLPMGMAENKAVYAAVDQAIAAIGASGLRYTVGPFETVIEGPLDQVYAAALAAHKALLAGGVGTAASYIKLWSGADLGSSAEKTDKYRSAGH
jgi:uncharacterized protein YqgV (UPF0045/DUF77 family)